MKNSKERWGIVSISIRLASVALFARAAMAAPPEVANLRFTNAQTLTWSSAGGAIGYHIYRDFVFALSSGFSGTCTFGNVEDLTVSDSATPPSGQAFFYLVDAMDESGEGSLGATTSGSVRKSKLACIPARRLFALTTNGPGSDGVEDGSSARTGHLNVTGSPGGSVSLALDTATGEVLLQHVGQLAGLASFGSTYRSQILYSGPLGDGWDFAFNMRLRPLPSVVQFYDGTGRSEKFTAIGGTSSFVSPAGLFGKLFRNGDGTYTLRTVGTSGIGVSGATGGGQRESVKEPAKVEIPNLVIDGPTCGGGVCGDGFTMSFTASGGDASSFAINNSHSNIKNLRNAFFDNSHGSSDPMPALFAINNSHSNIKNMRNAFFDDSPGGNGPLPAFAAVNTSHSNIKNQRNTFFDNSQGSNGPLPAFAAVNTSHSNIKNQRNAFFDNSQGSNGPLPAFAAVNTSHSNIKNMRQQVGSGGDGSSSADSAVQYRESDFDFVSAAGGGSGASRMKYGIVKFFNETKGLAIGDPGVNGIAIGDPGVNGLAIGDPGVNGIAIGDPGVNGNLSTSVGDDPLHFNFSAHGRLESIDDESGHHVSFLYDNQNLLTQIVDALGRVTTLSYNANGHLFAVTDFAGRQEVFSYDSSMPGHTIMSSIRSPLVTGTPNGNDFPQGKTTTFTYSCNNADPKMNGNLFAIIAPQQHDTGIPTVQISYGLAGTFSADRATVINAGGTNASGIPAGGPLTMTYSALNTGADPSLLDLPRRHIVITDALGNATTFESNAAGHLLTLIRATNREVRPGEPNYRWDARYNSDGMPLQIDLPTGKRLFMTWGSSDTYSKGNLLELRQVADTLSSGGRGNGAGGEANDIVWSFAYEPIGNHLRSVTDPKGNDPSYVPPNGGAWSPQRYTSTIYYGYQEGDPATNGINALASRFGIALGSIPFNLGDINGDGQTEQGIEIKPTRIEMQAVVLDPASDQAAIEGDLVQESVTLMTYNDHGQLVRTKDAECNVNEFTYNPETDPDGDGVPTPAPPDGRTFDTVSGGFLHSVLTDSSLDACRNNKTNPPPASVLRIFNWTPVGDELSGMVDGRGVLHSVIYNELHQVMEVREAAATKSASGPFGDPATGFGEDGVAPIASRTQFEYDGDDNLVTVVADTAGARGFSSTIRTSFTRDILGRVREVQQPITPSMSRTTRFIRDANGAVTQITEPVGNFHTLQYDELGRLYRLTYGAGGSAGGVPSTTSYDYDGDGDLVKFIDPAGGIIDYKYDGHDRRVRRIDQLGSELRWSQDPYSEDVSITLRGPVSGPPPAGRSGSTNVDLAVVRLLRDERGRVFRADQQLFVPAGASLRRPAVLNEGGLVAADGYINHAYEYDKLGRLTFSTTDAVTVSRFDYNGLHDVVAYKDGEANEMRVAYDANENPIEQTSVDHSSVTGPPDEAFVRTNFYDALDRPVASVDNLGQTWRFVWNVLGDLVTTTDPNGPPGGVISRRSPEHAGTIVPVNGHGNVTNNTYDGLGRRVRWSSILTATGKGDGTLTPTPDTSNAFNTDGKIEGTDDWNPNSRLVTSTDDRGNATQYDYDNLNRRVHTTCADGTRTSGDFDTRGNLVSTTDPNGTVATRSFDACSRLTRVQVAPGPGVEGTTLQQFEYDGLSRLTKATDNNDPADGNDDSTLQYVYDSLNRMLEEQESIGPAALPPRSIDYGWTADRRLTSVIHPNGLQMAYEYDASERMVQVTDTATSDVAQLQWFGVDRLHTVIYPNGARMTHLDNAGTSDIGYDGAARTILLRTLSPANALLAGFEYHYDPAGNVISQRRLHHTDSPVGSYRGEVYAFDSANRLVRAQRGAIDAAGLLAGPVVDDQQFTLDGAGNWPRFAHDSVTFVATPNSMNQYDENQSGGVHFDDGIPDDFLDPLGPPADGKNMSYDTNGNMTQTETFPLRYDFMNRPVRSLSGGLTSVKFAHDALGRLIYRDILGAGLTTTNRSFPSSVLGTLLEERDTNGSVLRVHRCADGNELWQSSSLGDFMLLPDAQGSVVALSDRLDGTPTGIKERVTYDAYGKPTFADTFNNPLFDGSGNPVEKSSFGNATLWLGWRYDHELGLRDKLATIDLGGFYCDDGTCFSTNTARPVSAYSSVSNVLKTKHDSLKNSINNAR